MVFAYRLIYGNEIRYAIFTFPKAIQMQKFKLKQHQFSIKISINLIEKYLQRKLCINKCSNYVDANFLQFSGIHLERTREKKWCIKTNEMK